jgi:hypothetical protein
MTELARLADKYIIVSLQNDIRVIPPTASHLKRDRINSANTSCKEENRRWNSGNSPPNTRSRNLSNTVEPITSYMRKSGASFAIPHEGSKFCSKLGFQSALCRTSSATLWRIESRQHYGIRLSIVTTVRRNRSLGFDTNVLLVRILIFARTAIHCGVCFIIPFILDSMSLNRFLTVDVRMGGCLGM